MDGDFELAVIGAGPIGLETARRAISDGYRVVLIEKGQVADSVRQWAHVRMFTPFEMNSSTAGRAMLEQQGRALPSADDILSGSEFAERYLQPLSEVIASRCTILTRHTVKAIGRHGFWKGDAIGQAERSEGSFQILCESAYGERMITARTVVDCSGTYANPNHLGAGGIPAVGERDVLTPGCFLITDPLGRDRAGFDGKTTLIIGSGYSAATTVVALAELAETAIGTRVIWRTRRKSETPIAAVPGDSLAERSSLTAEANRLASSHSEIDWKSGFAVTQLTRDFSGRIHVTLSGAGGDEQLVVDRIVANVGYRPDRSLYEELQVHECYASQGPIKLAASLLGQSGGDCMTTQAGGPELLSNPEPGFFILGSKSYGRDPRFLLRTGLQQIEQLFDAIREPAGQGAAE